MSLRRTTLGELAGRYGVSTTTVRRWLHAGLPHRRGHARARRDGKASNGALYIDARAVEAWLAEWMRPAARNGRAA